MITNTSNSHRKTYEEVGPGTLAKVRVWTRIEQILSGWGPILNKGIGLFYRRANSVLTESKGYHKESHFFQPGAQITLMKSYGTYGTRKETIPLSAFSCLNHRMTKTKFRETGMSMAHPRTINSTRYLSLLFNDNAKLTSLKNRDLLYNPYSGDTFCSNFQFSGLREGQKYLRASTWRAPQSSDPCESNDVSNVDIWPFSADLVSFEMLGSSKKWVWRRQKIWKNTFCSARQFQMC